MGHDQPIAWCLKVEIMRVQHDQYELRWEEMVAMGRCARQ